MSTNINLPFITADATGPKHLDLTLTRAKFEELTHDLVEATIEPTRKALADSGLSVGEIDKNLTRWWFFPYSGCSRSYQTRSWQRTYQKR